MCIKFQPNRSTDCQDDTTFEGKKHKPKFKGRTLVVTYILSPTVPAIVWIALYL